MTEGKKSEMMQCVFFKGKINNKEELCRESGITAADEQMLLEVLSEQYGCRFFDKLNGLFAFVLYDSDNDLFFCVRDRFGGQVLYYSVLENGRPVFSGSILEILSEYSVPNVFREDMLEVYLSYSYIPGEDTMFSGIFKPLPGYCYTFRNGSVQKARYFTPQYRIDRSRSLEEWSDQLSLCLDDVFSDAESCDASLLSGGIDSNYLAVRTGVAHTFTAAYTESDFSEVSLARRISEDLKAKHTALHISPEAYLASVEDTMRVLEQPSGDASAEALLLACRSIGRDYDRCYSGEGVDELFMGYYLSDVLGAPENIDPIKAGYIGSTQVFMEEDKKRFLKGYTVSKKMDYTLEAYALSAGADLLNRAALVDMLVWLNGNLLVNVCRAGEESHVALITPYLDNRLYDLSLQIPSEYKEDRRLTKIVFRRAAEKYLNRDSAYRPKRGFPVPVRLWMRRPDYIRTLTAAFSSETASLFFNCDELNSAYRDYIEDETDVYSWRLLWCVYCFLVWYKQFFSSIQKE